MQPSIAIWARQGHFYYVCFTLLGLRRLATLAALITLAALTTLAALSVRAALTLLCLKRTWHRLHLLYVLYQAD